LFAASPCFVVYEVTTPSLKHVIPPPLDVIQILPSTSSNTAVKMLLDNPSASVKVENFPFE